MLMIVLKYLWSLPTTSVGLLLIVPTFVTGGRGRWVDGVFELHGGVIRWMLIRLVPLPGGASAMTLGHIVIGQDLECLDHTREHERVHVRQVERWGLFFLPAYLGCSLWLLLRGRDAYRDNPFEREAFSVSPVSHTGSTEESLG